MVIININVNKTQNILLAISIETVVMSELI